MSAKEYTSGKNDSNQQRLTMECFSSKNRGTALFFLVFLTLALLFSCSKNETSAQKYLDSAKAYFAENKLKEAEIEYKNVIQIQPANEYAHMQLSKIYKKLNTPKKELMSLLKVVAINPDNMNAQQRLGQVYLLGGQTKKARETVKKILIKKPDNTMALHMLATVQVQERNVDAALATLAKAISMEPENPALHVFLGYLLYYDKNNFEKSENQYLKALSLDNTLSEAYEELVSIYIREKLYDRAERLLVDWTKIPGNLKQKFMKLARFYESRGKIKKAEETYLKLVADSQKNDPGPIHSLGLFYYGIKEYSKAAASFKKALNLRKDLDIQSELANVYFDMNDYSNAKSQVAMILADKSNHSGAKLLQCKLLITEKLYVKALENIDQLIAIDKKSVEAYYLKALCLIQKDLQQLPAQNIRMAATGELSSKIWKRNLAIDSLKMAVELSKDYVAARMLLADLYIKNNNYTQADHQLEYVLKNFPAHQGALLMFGNLKIIKKEWGAARDVFLRIIKQKPDYSLAYVKLGLIYYSINEPAKAIELFKQALAVDPLNMNALRQIVTVYMADDQKESARQILSDHIKHPRMTKKEKAYIKFLQGKIALSQGAVDKAKKYFNESIKTYGKTTPSYEALAMISERDGNLFKAVKYYELILSYNPEFLPAYLSLSRIYQAEDNITKAREVLEKILNLQDDFAPAANDLAYILAQEGRELQKALHLARVAESQDPGNAYVLDTLGWIYYKQKSYDLAINKFLASIKINPDIALSHYHLGWAYYDTGRYEKARAQMKQALKIDSDFKGAAKARELIGG